MFLNDLISLMIGAVNTQKHRQLYHPIPYTSALSQACHVLVLHSLCQLCGSAPLHCTLNSFICTMGWSFHSYSRTPIRNFTQLTRQSCCSCSYYVPHKLAYRTVSHLYTDYKHRNWTELIGWTWRLLGLFSVTNCNQSEDTMLKSNWNKMDSAWLLRVTAS